MKQFLITMKQFLIKILALLTYIDYADTQTLKPLLIEPAHEETSSVFRSTCNSSDLAVVEPIPSVEQIELQASGSKVYYRNIYVKEL